MSNCNNYVPNSCPKCPQGCPELFEEVLIPSVMGDDKPSSNVKPENGAYKNKIVRYESNGHTYMYDSKGIPIPIGSDSAGGVYKTTAILKQAVGDTTTIDFESIDASMADVVIGETLVWDDNGTVATVTGIKNGEITVVTITAMPGERAGTLLGTVNHFADVPLTKDEVKELGFQDPIIGDTITVRTDETRDDSMTKYMIHDIDSRGNIIWVFDHIVNDGDYQFKSEGAWDGKILTAGRNDGEFGEPIDPLEFVHNIEINGNIIDKDENGVVKFTSVAGIRIGEDEEVILDDDGIANLPSFVRTISIGGENIPQDNFGNIDLPSFVKSISLEGTPLEKDEFGNVDIDLPDTDTHYVIRMNYDGIESTPETEIRLSEASVAEVIKNTEVITLQDFYDNVKPKKDIVIIHGTKDQVATNECVAQFIESDGTDLTFYVLIDTKGGGGGAGGEAVLTEPINVSNPLGRYTQGKRIDVGTPLEEIIRNILEKVSYPTLTNPSVSLSYRGPVLKEIGEVVSGETATLTFDRGKINPAYGTSGFRSGEANKYTFFNNNVENVTATTTYNIPDMTEDTTLQAKVDYDAGEQPKDSDNKNYNSPLPAGSVSSSKVTIEFVYAVWSNAAVNDTIAKMPLYNKATQYVTLDFANAVPEHPETVDIPNTWTVSGVEVYDTVSKSWQATTDFDTTTTQHDDAAGRSVDYTRYFDKRGFTQGARQVRLKVKVN